MKAVQVETFRWCTFSKLAGFTLFRDDQQLPGMITVSHSDIAGSLESEIQRYLTEYHVLKKYPDGTRELISGPYATVTYDEVLNAIKAAFPA